MLLISCKREESPAVIQARAAVVMAESDLRQAQAEAAAAEGSLASAQASLAMTPRPSSQVRTDNLTTYQERQAAVERTRVALLNYSNLSYTVRQASETARFLRSKVGEKETALARARAALEATIAAARG